MTWARSFSLLPEAKIFLDASAEERANRRLKQLQDKGINVKFDDLLREIQERDDRDRNRPVASVTTLLFLVVQLSNLKTALSVMSFLKPYKKVRS